MPDEPAPVVRLKTKPVVAMRPDLYDKIIETLQYYAARRGPKAAALLKELNELEGTK